MTYHPLKPDGRAVSSVVGTILLVALTVLVVTTISVFVLGLDLTNTACNAGLPARLQSVTDPVCP